MFTDIRRNTLLFLREVKVRAQIYSFVCLFVFTKPQASLVKFFSHTRVSTSCPKKFIPTVYTLHSWPRLGSSLCGVWWKIQKTSRFGKGRSSIFRMHLEIGSYEFLSLGLTKKNYQENYKIILEKNSVQSLFSANHTGVLVQESAVMQAMICSKKLALQRNLLWLVIRVIKFIIKMKLPWNSNEKIMVYKKNTKGYFSSYSLRNLWALQLFPEFSEIQNYTSKEKGVFLS